MKFQRPKPIGTGLLLAGLISPLAANADHDEDDSKFVVGAALTFAHHYSHDTYRAPIYVHRYRVHRHCPHDHWRPHRHRHKRAHRHRPHHHDHHYRDHKHAYRERRRGYRYYY